MRTLFAIALAATAGAAVVVPAPIVSQPAPSTIEQCAALLPQGKTYSFQISGSVDTTGAAPVLSGEMSISDGTEEDRSEESAAFGQCLARLIR